ncbi:MAG: CRISPR-associated helicase Cas3' [Candidatus Zipacnadales bacterium]
MTYLAHSPNKTGQPHVLRDDLRAVAELAGQFAAAWGGEEVAKLAGLLHDLGKYRKEFQAYLAAIAANQTPVRAPHSAYGARYAEQLTAIDAVFAIAGHHGGLPDLADLPNRLGTAAPELVLASARQDLAELEQLKALPVPESLRSDRLAADLHIRMLFSCLVDADFLDTEAHLNPARADLRTTKPLQAAELLERLVAHVETLPRQEPVNAQRREVFSACLAAGSWEPGFFSLTVPTGGGKTLSSMAFALSHAHAHGLRRIIYVIPYLSIIEQNAQVFEQVLGKEWVLQHHSLTAAQGRPGDVDESVSIEAQYAQLATENWDAPIIVTTTVQFFESLFANRPSACRKLHNIARSVVIFDECQTLPPGLLEPILSVLQTLRSRYFVSMVFCTATQPAFGKSEHLPQGLHDIREIAPDPPKLFKVLRRTRVQWPSLNERWPWEQVAQHMCGAPNSQALCIVNTKRQAYDLTHAVAAVLKAEIETVHSIGLFHLSTNMCPVHRLEVLASIKQRLHEGRSCLVAATQLVEAGVDLDFPTVLRALGPFDSIAQAAGRCNREGLRHMGEVIVFTPEDDAAPKGWYESGRAVTRALLRDGEPDIHQPEIFLAYFGQLYGGGCLDQKNIQESRRQLAFETVARGFHLIEQATRPVLVFYDEQAKQLIGQLEKCYRPDRQLMRQLQVYTLNLYESVIYEALKSCDAVELLPGIYTWEGRYDPIFGIVLSDMRLLEA